MKKYFDILILCFITANSIAGDMLFTGNMRTNKTLNVDLAINCDANTQEITGSYVYKHIGKNIPLEGFTPKREDSNSIFLQEEIDEKVTGVFVLEWDDSRLEGYWTNFKSRYPVSLQPSKVVHYQETGEDSPVAFTLYSVAESFYDSELFLSFDHYENLRVGRVPNCNRMGRVEMAWLTFNDDGSFALEIREEFWGMDGEHYRTHEFDASGRPKK